jgi:ribosomal-protein-alanine acetyltransferase
MHRVIGETRREYGIPIMQVEYTHMATYGGDVLVEHDVTFDLYAQILERERTTAAKWNWWRWRRFEIRAVRKFRKVIVMSEKDAALLGAGNVAVIPNGVDLDRFQPEPEQQGQRILFIGSFRHFPNVVAYRFFTEEVWPRLREQMPDVHFTAVTGPDADIFWKEHNPNSPPYCDDHVELLGFVSDVRPLYAQTNLVVVPTKVSAGTNLKVLEAMAMERAVVSTASGCAGLGLVHGKSVWVAETAEEFAAAVVVLLNDSARRQELAHNARAHAEKHFDWRMLGKLQRDLWMDLLPKTICVRQGRGADLEGITSIQALSHLSSNWDASSYLLYDLRVAEMGSTLVGFMASRSVEDETEILNVAVHPNFRRRGVATRLIESIAGASLFLEVRESNSTAQELYRKLGFEMVGRRDNYYDDPVEDALVMRLSRKLKRVNF